ncbi:MAG: hypothetical protein GY929_08630 [Actinomycetia bacterium]|nr:hypothetical protein [Actinomycetes bacterium]
MADRTPPRHPTGAAHPSPPAAAMRAADNLTAGGWHVDLDRTDHHNDGDLVAEVLVRSELAG